MNLNLSLGACECVYESEVLCAIMGRGMRESEHELVSLKGRGILGLYTCVYIMGKCMLGGRRSLVSHNPSGVVENTFAIIRFYIPIYVMWKE